MQLDNEVGCDPVDGPEIGQLGNPRSLGRAGDSTPRGDQ